jgi:hypothetical protein
MAFVWSRLALAAVLAVGGATTVAASPAADACGPRCGDEAPRLDCTASSECSVLVVDLGDASVDPPAIAPETLTLPAPQRAACDVVPTLGAPFVAVAQLALLDVAPKTSPPRA